MRWRWPLHHQPEEPKALVVGPLAQQSAGDEEPLCQERIPGPGADFDPHQGLFVIGSARSGTTLVAKVLNLSAEVFLLEEGFFYRDGNNPCFCSLFNQRHVDYGHTKAKGLYVPKFHGRDHTAWELLVYLARYYRYVGEKVAMGPWIDWDGPLLEFHAAHFFFSRYVLTLRRPEETVWSMWKHYRKDGDPPWHYLRCYLAAFRVVLEFLAVFPHTWVVLHERLSREHLERLAEELGLRVQILPKMVMSPEEQASHLAPGAALPQPLQELHPWLSQAEELHRAVALAVDASSMRYSGEYGLGEWSRKLIFRAKALEAQLLERFSPPAETGRQKGSSGSCKAA